MSIVTEINKICRQIVDNFQPQKVILFGSHAYGKPNADSDVDLLVVMPFEGSEARKAYEMRLKLKSDLPYDLLVRTSQQISERIEMEDCFMREIIERGKVLYETDNSRMD